MRDYFVTFTEPLVVVEKVRARSQREAIELVKMGEGDRLSSEVDESRFPTRYRASLDLRAIDAFHESDVSETGAERG